MSNNALTEEHINFENRTRPFGRGSGGTTGGPGPTGPTGPTGPAGADGADGAQGVAGADGADGADGAQGVAGADGAQGIQGIQGPVGAQGPSGVAGAVAPAGLLWKGQWVTATSYELNNTVGFGGASYFCIDFVNPYVADATVYPSNHVSDGTEVGKHIVFLQDSTQLGTAGGGIAVVISLAKSYEITGFNTPNNTIRVVDDNGTDVWCKLLDPSHLRNRGTAWEFGTAQTTNDPTVDTTNWALMASQGSPGADGSQGADGAQGSEGPTGPQGLTGPAGAQGATGPDGADGADGPQGPAGEGAGQMEVVTRATRGTGTSKGEMKWEEDKKAIIIWDGTSWIVYGVPATAPDSAFTPAPGNFYYGQTVTFTDASTDEDGSVVEREWSNNFNSDTETGASYEVTLPVGNPGDTGVTVQVTLNVEDDSGLKNAQVHDYTLQIAPLIAPPLSGEGVILADDGTDLTRAPIIKQAEMIFNAGGSGDPDETTTFYTN